MVATSAPAIALVGSSGFAAKMVAPALARSGCGFAGVLGSGLAGSHALAELYGTMAYGGLDELLSDPAVDALWVTAKDSLHAPIGVQCLAAGKHLLMEKPLARTLAEAEALAAAAAASASAVARVGFHQRFRPGYRRLREGVAGGRVGLLRHVRLQFFFAPFTRERVERSWRSSAAETGGTWILKEYGAHMLDLLLWLTGCHAQVGGALLSRLAFDVETDDTASLLLRLDGPAAAGGAVATIEVSAALADLSHRIEIHGDRGHVEAQDLFFGEGELRWSDGGSDRFEAHEPLQPYLDQLADFAAALNGARGSGATFAEALDVQRLIEAGRAIAAGLERGRA